MDNKKLDYGDERRNFFFEKMRKKVGEVPSQRELFNGQVVPFKPNTAQIHARNQSLFFEAVKLEEKGSKEDARKVYEEILNVDNKHAPAAINLGTIVYNERDFIEAERLYRQATLADPDYALAFFDLGNVLDELGRLPEAITAYSRAIELLPKYGDAHYNVALAYERSGEWRKALKHWTTYIKLDPIGPWSNHARIQADKMKAREKLTLEFRNPEPRQKLAAEDAPKLRPAIVRRETLDTLVVPNSVPT